MFMIPINTKFIIKTVHAKVHLKLIRVGYVKSLCIKNDNSLRGNKHMFQGCPSSKAIVEKICQCKSQNTY